MRIQFAVLRIIVFVVLARTCSLAEAQKIVKRVVINSAEGGMGGGIGARVVIKRKGDKFLSNGRPVSAVQVQALLDALSAAPMIVPDSKNLGITDEWLAAKIESLRPRNVAATQKSFITLTLIDSALPNLLTVDPQNFDYFPFCNVEIVFEMAPNFQLNQSLTPPSSCSRGP